MAKNADDHIIQFTLEGEIFWPSFYKTDQYDKYGCVLGNLSAEEVTKAEEANLKVSESEDYGFFVRLVMKEFKKDAKTGQQVKNDLIEVADAATRKRWDPKVGIGNGTTAKVRGISIRWDDKENKWTNKLQQVRILKLVEYAADPDGDAWELVEDDEDQVEDAPKEVEAFDEDQGDELPDMTNQSDALSALD